MEWLISNVVAETEMKNIDWRTRPFDLPTSDTVWLCYVGDKLPEMISSTIANLNIIDKLANHTVYWDSMRWSTTSKNKFKWLTLKSWFLTKKRNVSQYYLQQSFSGLLSPGRSDCTINSYSWLKPFTTESNCRKMNY